MVLSLSNTTTTLWDQVQYQGEPAEFAWVLPTFGTVEVGVSSDALFAHLENLSAVEIRSPVTSCIDLCSLGQTANASGGGLVSDTETSSVELVAHEVVGPYETVQLSSSDPMALRDWLSSHGFAIPAAIEPVIDAYVGEGADFLAIRLVPGAGVDAMRPIRVTFQGAVTTLPLRMIAAGAGAETPVSLFIMSEGVYLPTSMPWGSISGSALTWDYDTRTSSYAAIREEFYAYSGGNKWLVESGTALVPEQIDPLLELAQSDPAGSGYGASDGTGAYDEATADVAKLVGELAPQSLVLTHISARLSQSALASDLALGASNFLPTRVIDCENYVGTPTCPPQPECTPGTGGGGDGGSMSESQSDGCTVGKPSSSCTQVSLFAAVAALGLYRRRRRRLSASSPRS